jgi:RNA polymerase sigma-70 factor (ECF subfamily)
MSKVVLYNEKDVLELLKNEETQRRAFTMIVDRYKEQLYWQIRRMVLSHEDTDDILQNTFIKAWVNINLFRGDAKMATWLYRIAMNECITFINKQRAQNEMSIDEADAAVAEKLDGDAYFDGDKAQRLLQKALLTLPVKQRMVFNMKYYQEMKYEEMSDIFGTSVGALKASYFHAVKKIEKYIQLND